MEKPNYYAIIPAPVRYDNELRPNEKLLYGEITALCGASGYCWSTNQYFADLYGVTVRMVREWISHLRDRGYVNLQMIYKEGTKEVQERRIYIIPISNVRADPPEEIFPTSGKKVPDPSGKKVPTPGEKKFLENNTRVNITSMNKKENITKEKTESETDSVPESDARPKRTNVKFTKPTVEDIRNYCRERNNTVDAEHFYDYYESNGWKVGKNTMKNWKAAVRTWERNGYDSGKRGSDPFDIRNQYWDENDPTVH